MGTGTSQCQTAAWFHQGVTPWFHGQFHIFHSQCIRIYFTAAYCSNEQLSSGEDRGNYHTLEDDDYDDDHTVHTGSTRSYPTHEWSPPVADLSPIEDVPSTLELEAEAEWLAYQRNGKEENHSNLEYCEMMKPLWFLVPTNWQTHGQLPLC